MILAREVDMLVLEYKVKAHNHQLEAINQAIRTTQFVRNKCLRFWMDSKGGDKINYAVLCKYSTTLRSDFSFAKQLNSMAVQAAVERTWFSICRFSDNCKKKTSGKKGYPKFQKDNRSVEYKTSGWSLNPNKREITITDKTGIGKLKLLGKWDLLSYPLDQIKRVRIVKRADGYYCQICFNVDSLMPLNPSNQTVGLDVGLEYFYSDSKGHQEENPRFLRKSEQLIKRTQRRISKRKKGSNNRIKARRLYARRHLRISRQRKEHAKRLARCVCTSNDVVVYENLKVRNLVRNPKLAKSINDAGWYQFRVWLEHFAKKFGKQAVAVEPHYTSQECSSCKKIVKKSLSTRTHICSCGLRLNRDVNAALNILSKGLTQIGWGASESTPGE